MQTDGWVDGRTDAEWKPGGRYTVANCGYYFCDLFIKIECIQLFFDVSMVIV